MFLGLDAGFRIRRVTLFPHSSRGSGLSFQHLSGFASTNPETLTQGPRFRAIHTFCSCIVNRIRRDGNMTLDTTPCDFGKVLEPQSAQTEWESREGAFQNDYPDLRLLRQPPPSIRVPSHHRAKWGESIVDLYVGT